MSDNLKKQPKKGILKNSSSFESEERQKEMHKGTKFDEMNIIATLHPKDKDYGHMKIEEPKTPFSYNMEGSGDEMDGLDADLLTEKIKLEGNVTPRSMRREVPEESSEEEEEDTPEEKAKRQAFEMKRKHHYNEFAAVKLARKLMERDLENEVEDEDQEGSNKHDNKIQEEEEEEEEEGGREEEMKEDKLASTDSG